MWLNWRNRSTRDCRSLGVWRISTTSSVQNKLSLKGIFLSLASCLYAGWTCPGSTVHTHQKHCVMYFLCVCVHVGQPCIHEHSMVFPCVCVTCISVSVTDTARPESCSPPPPPLLLSSVHLCVPRLSDPHPAARHQKTLLSLSYGC